jgi:RNA polymerase sigma-70 factor (ECF subfamily)
MLVAIRVDDEASDQERREASRLSAKLDFRTIYEARFEEVSRWIRALGGPKAEREDLVQEVFLVVFRRLPDFDGNNVAGWLYQITRRRVRDFRRRFWVRNLLFGSVPVSEELTKGEASAADSLETKEKRALLERLLGKLSESERAALSLFEFDGYTGEQIANVQGVSINTVWARIHHARKKLKAWLAIAEQREGRIGR